MTLWCAAGVCVRCLMSQGHRERSEGAPGSGDEPINGKGPCPSSRKNICLCLYYTPYLKKLSPV